jgi:hypothetical protein
MKPISILAVAAFLAVLPSSVRSQESLGDTARKVKPKDAQVTSKRVFTDEDVAHANPNQLADSALPTDPKIRLSEAQRLVDKLSNKTPRELSNGIVGENKFPGRDNWEERLAAQRDRVIQAAQMALDVARKIVSDSTPEEKANATKAGNQALSNFDLEMGRYNRMVAEGIHKASDWGRNR